MSFLNSRNVFNPIGLVRGIGQAAHDVFAPQPQAFQLSEDDPRFAAASQNGGMMLTPNWRGEAPAPEHLLRAGVPVTSPADYINQFTPQQQAAQQGQPQGFVSQQPMGVLDKVDTTDQALEDYWNEAYVKAMAQDPGPAQVINQFGQLGQNVGGTASGAAAPVIGGYDPNAPTLTPFQNIPQYPGQPLNGVPGNQVGQYGYGAPSPAASQASGYGSPDVSGLMKNMYAEQLVNSNNQANAWLNYAQNDLQRRSARDNSDDFFGSVVAPIAGGMMHNVPGANAMADRWMGQAQGRRGERTELINQLAGRQNKAQEYLQATDPQVIKNQVALYKAQTDANRASYYGQSVSDQHTDRVSEIQRKAAADAANANYKQGLLKEADARIDIAKDQLGLSREAEARLKKQMEATIDNFIADNQRADKQLDQNQNQFDARQSQQDEQFNKNLNSTDKRFYYGQDAATNRTQMNIDAGDRRTETVQQNINMRKANDLSDKGKATATKTFQKLYSLPPVVQHQVQRYQSLPKGPMRQAARQAIKANYGYDPGE